MLVQILVIISICRYAVLSIGGKTAVLCRYFLTSQTGWRQSAWADKVCLSNRNIMIDITIAYGLNTVLTEGNVSTCWGIGFSFVATDACYFSGKTLTGIFFQLRY